MFDQEKNFHLMSLSILITCLPNNVRILEGEVTHESHLEVKRINHIVQVYFTHVGKVRILILGGRSAGVMAVAVVFEQRGLGSSS